MKKKLSAVLAMLLLAAVVSISAFAKESSTDTAKTEGAVMSNVDETVLTEAQEKGKKNTGRPGTGTEDGTGTEQPPQGGMNGMGGMDGMMTEVTYAGEAGEIAEGTVENSAEDLQADMDNAVTFIMTDEDNTVEISEAGTYIVTGSCQEGSVTVKKGTEGVVLVLQDLTLSSTNGAPVSLNKETEVKLVISGEVVLTDDEDPADETSEDTEIADAFDGAALKIKADAVVYLTGDGTLTLNGNAKNGLKGGDASSIMIDGPEIVIRAENDAVNVNEDLAIRSGSLDIEAGDDAIHAERILTIGSEETDGPEILISSCSEGLEGTVINLVSGTVEIHSTDDAVNAANSDGTYLDSLTFSFNMLGGSLIIESEGDGIDSNGNINFLDGSAVINSRAGAGEAGIDYVGQIYLSDTFELTNNSGFAHDPFGGMGGQGMMPGMNGEGGMMPGMNGEGGMMPGMNGEGGMMPGMNGQNGMMPGMNGRNGRMPGMNGQNGMMPEMNGEEPVPETAFDNDNAL